MQQFLAPSASGTISTVNFAANATTATVTVTPIGDVTLEEDETLSLSLTPGSGYVLGDLLGDQTTAIGTIRNAVGNSFFNRTPLNLPNAIGGAMGVGTAAITDLGQNVLREGGFHTHEDRGVGRCPHAGVPPLHPVPMTVTAAINSHPQGGQGG